MQLFVNAYKDFVAKVSGSPAFNEYTVCILEKLAYLGLALALDSAVAGAQKREILGTQSAQIVLNPAAELARIDPNLIADTRPVRQRFARFSLQIGERTVMKITTKDSGMEKNHPSFGEEAVEEEYLGSVSVVVALVF
ncbi:Beige protein-like 1 [Stygiomarasmius scandens]|uniref:Beige protein-like 1 n=1 Tax=Marasmiellus scandens TaxID=2682957 RepID=A0ABR1IM36_9AGAR